MDSGSLILEYGGAEGTRVLHFMVEHIQEYDIPRMLLARFLCNSISAPDADPVPGNTPIKAGLELMSLILGLILHSSHTQRLGNAGSGPLFAKIIRDV